MSKEAFHDNLLAKRNSPLYGALSKYQHVVRLSSGDAKGLLNGKVVVMPKIDGANMTVAWVKDKGHVIASHNGAKSIGGNPPNGFRRAIQYALNHPGLMELSKQYILRGEWLVKHTILYPPEVMKHFYVFDVQRYDTGEYIPVQEYIPLLEKYNIKYVPVLAELENPSSEELTKFVPGPSVFKELNNQKEGIVIKRYDFVNKYGRTQWGKIVNADFQKKNKIAFNRPGKGAEAELAFAATCVTQELVLKTIEKIKTENNGQIDIKFMGQIIGRTYYDIFHEELWDFIKKRKVGEFNFRKAQGFCTDAIRDIALAYFNNTLMETDK